MRCGWLWEACGNAAGKGCPKTGSQNRLLAAIFGDIDSNPFLNELYDNILYNYSLNKFDLTGKRQLREIDVVSALRFADLLSKSTHAVNRDKHKMWAQEIIILLHSLYPEDSDVKLCLPSKAISPAAVTTL